MFNVLLGGFQVLYSFTGLFHSKKKIIKGKEREKRNHVENAVPCTAIFCSFRRRKKEFNLAPLWPPLWESLKVQYT